MKALRKCACVAVQVVVATALLFQQCPVQAIALGLEQRSDYVEIPSSEEGTDDADDSSAAPSNDGDSNEAVPSSPEKDEAASGADNAGGVDNAKQNTQSDGDATNSGEATPASVPDEELVWNRLGTLEWSKDANKNVILRPADGAESATYEGEIRVSDLFGESVKSFKAEGLLSLGSISFSGCKAIKTISLTNVSVKGSTNSMFEGCSTLAALDLSSFDTSSVTYMSSMFRGCSSLTSLDLSSFDTTSVTGMPYMFEGCSSLAVLDLSSFDTSSVKYMYDMFSGCSSLAALDLSSFDTSSVTDMLSMFEGCSSLASIDLSSFDTSSVTRMSSMFKGCSSLASIDLLSFNTTSVTDMYSMFNGCSSLMELDLSSFDTSPVLDMGYMLSNCSMLKRLDISSFDTRAGYNCYGCFHGMHLGLIKVGANCDENLTREIDSTYKGFRVSWENRSGVSFARIPALVADDYKATASLGEARFNVDLSDELYTGRPIVKQLASLDGLIEKEDYSICYSDNVNCGTATLKVIGNGVFRGERVFNYVIKKAPAGYVMPTDLRAVYGQKLSDVKLPEGFSWEDPSLSVGNPGENTFKCKFAAPDESHTGAEGIEVEVRVTRPVEASMFSVDAKGLAYTGRAHEPAVSSKVVPEGSFSVSYRDNVAAGKAVAVVKGSGFYTGTCEIPFTIAKAKPSYKAPAGIAAIYGQKLSDVKLPEGFSWEDPSLSVGDPGENTFKCRYAAPDDNHTGADGIEVEVRVTRSVEASMFSVDAEGLAYTGKAHEPAVSSKVVPEDSFSVTYRDNVAAGKAAAVVKGSGFYTGTCEVPFSIAKAKPSYKVPATLAGVYGKKLSDVKLPEGFSWSDPSMRIDWYGSKSIKATYTPSDTKNYEVVKGVEVSVFVGRNVIAVPTIKDLVYSGSVQAPSVGIDGTHVVENAGGVNVGEYSVELALNDPVLDCWVDGTTENKTIAYRIVPVDINAAEIAPISPCLLKDGKAEPTIKATFKGSAIAMDCDYTLAYVNNKKVGAASVVIKGKGNFTGERTVPFKIAKGDLGDYNVTSKRAVYLYNGKDVAPRVFVSAKDGSDVPREGVDYKVTYTNNNAVGIGHATISGIGDYIGSQTVDFAIVDTIDLSTYCTAHAYDAFYTGDEVCPRVDVRLNTESHDEACGNGGASRSDDAPIEGQDYTVSYEDNVEPGMATAVVRGRGRYVGEVRVQFHILRKSDFDLSDCSVRLDPPSGADRYSYALKGGEYSFLYTGSAVEPDVSVSLYSGSGIYVELRAGVDYELDYRSNTEPGSATVAVRGINGLSGSRSLGFSVVRKLSVADLLLTKYDFEQSVYQLKPGFALAPKLKASPSFIEGADYTLSYSNCDKVGNGLVTVTGIGRYAGSVVIEVPIVESLDRPLLSECCFGKIEDQVYTGSEIYPSVVLKNSSGVEVDQTKECSLRYSNNVNVGKATVTASESASSSSYIGEVSTGFNILPADIDDAYFVPIGGATYTGNAVEPDVLVRFNGKTLVKGTDYDLSYSDNVEVGTAHVVVTGKGNFGGKREMTFNIVRPVIEFDQDMVEGETVSTRWNGKVNTTNYRIVLERGGMVRIRTGFLSIDTVFCSIKNENGDIIDAWAPADGMVYGFFALPAGTYYFEYVGSPKAYGGSVYASYSVTRFGEPANTIYEVEDNNGTAEGHTIAGDATPVEVGRFFAGSNYYATTGGFGDIDYFKFTVTKRGRYSMSLATNARLMFALTDAQGNILNNRDTGSSVVVQSGSEQLAGLDFGTLEPGTYYVRVLSNDRTAVGSPYYGFIFDSSDPVPAEKGVGRVSGDTRYDTMGSLAGRGNWAVGGSVILASGANYPDALAASSLAGGLDAPILLTDPNSLSDAARDRLETFCPSRVFIVGGNAAVSPDVERQVKELLGSGCAVFRVAGQTRYETSLVAAEVNPKSSDTVIVATGSNYADALSVSPYAFASGSPVLLCDSSSGLTGAAVESIRSGGYSKAVIVGGTAAVPASVEGQLRSAGIGDVTRLSGATRFETSSMIADFELGSGLGFSMDGVLLATGMNFPDALSAGPLAGRSRAPLLLVDPGAEHACTYLSGFRGKVSSATVVGGAAAVPEEDRLAIARILGI